MAGASSKTTIYAVNGSGGAYVAIPSTAGSRRVTIVECPPAGGSFNDTNFAPQGLNYKLPRDGFVQVYPNLPGQAIVLGDSIAWGKGAGALLGGPAQTDPGGRTIPATTYIELISATVTGTQVAVTEES